MSWFGLAFSDLAEDRFGVDVQKPGFVGSVREKARNRALDPKQSPLEQEIGMPEISREEAARAAGDGAGELQPTVLKRSRRELR
ncbi:hypothetical protein L1887_03374 [Cichorium endivia]|nr:hypothetical protein L1887_03374 [Cichorium endivia]